MVKANWTSVVGIKSTSVPRFLSHTHTHTVFPSTPYTFYFNMASTEAKILFTKEELSEFEQLFAEFDKDKDGKVDRAELAQLTKSLGEQATAEELEFVISSFDTNNDGALDYKEFVSLMSTLRSASRD